ncbi:hypothetical protein BX600DRAFT_530728 [Xylariales sp. PMI_506]|nr:hypothetical protein BX600DRAFT_530728 [Xylariales sp. PMI_506]
MSISAEELDQIWKWNASVPNPIEGCVHDLITLISREQPDSLAVCAWDGNFTYSELDALANEVAQAIIDRGTAPKSTIPILFSKSRWACVAMLGVIKAGCSAVALDAGQPDLRLRSIVQQIQPTTIISSANAYVRASLLSSASLFQIDDSLFNLLKESGRESRQLPAVLPSDLVYVSFTSGTTGQPKGACISHSNVRSAVYYQGQKLGFHRKSRVFDFAPYSFDVAWSNFLHTLCAGGTLCIASEADMLADLSSAITTFQATLINVTPTVLRTITSIPPSLESVLLSGEMPYRENLISWAGHVRLLNTYGPTECTFKCAFSVLTPTQEGRPDIGKGVGFATWLVDLENSDRLVPIGSVGELCLEGPLVGQGYLSDSEKTALAFINQPKWLQLGSETVGGRQARLYKTGDLMKYTPDGRLLFVGRKDDSQLKIRGQRVEIGDVEHHVRASLDDALPVIVDMIRPRDGDSTSLVLFAVVRPERRERAKALMDNLADKLQEVLPGFMIPSVYIPIDEIPVASTGKIDRRRLREMGSALAWSEILHLQSTILSAMEFVEPECDAERQLRQIWADVLKLDAVRISTVDSFLRLGGDSIAAIRVVAAARDQNLALDVADLFRTPVLKDLAQIAETITDISFEEEIPPFSLLMGVEDNTSICTLAAKICGVPTAEIADIYPCTPLQQGMLAMTAKHIPNGHIEGSSSNPADYISRTAFELGSDIEIDRFKEAWARTANRASIIRTRIIDLPRQGLVQVVVNSPPSLVTYSNTQEFVESATPVNLGTPLCRVGLVMGETRHFVLEMHHAAFDGWSNGLILNAIESFYHDNQTIPNILRPYQLFIRHVLSMDSPKATDFWRKQLAGSEAAVFPVSKYSTKKKLDVHHTVSGLQWPQTGITQTTIIRSALSLLLASYTNSDDVKYGVTVSGRSAPVPGIEQIAAPTIATIPVRVKFDWDQTVQSFKQQIQQQAVDAIEYEQFGLQRIQRIDEEIEEASKFQLLLVVQAAEQGGKHKQASSAPTTLVTKDGQADSLGMYNSYGMMIICQLEDSGVRLNINFDSGAMEEEAVQRFAVQLEYVLQQLCTTSFEESKLSDISCVSKQDLSRIWKWNEILPRRVEESVVTMVERRAAEDSEALAISGWDKQLTYHELVEFSTALAERLRKQGVEANSVLVLNFEKSAWLTVSMLAAFKIGAVALPVSVPTSSQRAREIVEALHPKLVLTSSGISSSAFHELTACIALSDLTQPSHENEVCHDFQPHINLQSDPAIIVFTSGSTGLPKPILWNHGVLSSNIRGHSASFGVTDNSRVFQFAGYDFDVSTVESLSTLSVGGCLYIPSEQDRISRLSGTILQSNANWLCLTPSVAETLIPEELPSVRTLVLAGEKLPPKAAFRWSESLDSVYNWYGPAEASVATSCPVEQLNWGPGMTGKSITGATWLVDPRNPNTLAPVGAIAELCMEGPIVAIYTGESGNKLNEKHFFAPQWLLSGSEEIPGRSGRLYRTGDLVKYAIDGSMVFIGRREDAQRKLRGQRIDISEIEHRVQAFLSGEIKATAVAEIITLAGSETEILSLFISPTGPIDASEEDAASFLKQCWPVERLEEALLHHLPSYMIPRVSIPIAKMPITQTGKTDRRRLRLIGSRLTHEQLAAMQPSRREARKPSTSMERLLQEHWAEVIGIDAGIIDAHDSFLRLGGDSISAMRLVALLRHRGFLLTVADTFEAPYLEDMALRVRPDLNSVETEVSPFSMIGQDLSASEARSYAAQICSVLESEVVDIYPCTALQQGLLALGVKKHGQYVSRSVLDLQPEIDSDRLTKAWLATVEKLPLLRTRIIDLLGQGFVQVVLNSLPMRYGSDLDTYVLKDQQEKMEPGTELCRAAIINRSFILTIHHCTYDGNTLKMILDELESQYLGGAGMTVTPFKNFVQHLSNIVQPEAAEFWKRQISNSEARQFPSLPSASYNPKANESFEHLIPLHWPRNGMTPSTIIRSAWALLMSQYTSSNDVVFAVTVSGRQANMRGIENCVGPTISTVPLAISVDWDDTIEAFQGRLQRQMVEATPYEQYGLQNIQRLHEDWHSRFLQTLLVVQPMAEWRSLDEDSFLFKARSLSSNIETLGSDPFNIYALMVLCELESSVLRLRLSFDSNIIDKDQIRRIAQQFETVLHQMCSDAVVSMKVDDIQTASRNDLRQFWSQNAELPETPDSLVPSLISLAARKQPEAIAIDSWDGRFSYQDVDELSTTLSHRLLQLGVKKGSVVAVNFEKTKWVPVVLTAIYKAGAVDVLQSSAVPDLRVGKVFANLGVELAIISESRRQMVSQFARCFTVDELLQMPPDAEPKSLPVLSIHDPAAILISSGSTGEPKQVLWSHRAFTANIKAHGKFLGVSSSSRLFQFAAYDFDICTIETMSTLVHMGCLCIPSEAERVGGTTGAINRFGVNFMCLTPSTAKTLQSEDVPGVRTIVLAGENVLESEVNRWKGRCQVLNWYGPAEHPSTVCAADVDTWHSGVIGSIDSKQPALIWLVDPRNHNRLMPFGAVGEIALEGPLAADGYIGNPELTALRFRKDPAFLWSGDGQDTPGRRGDIYCSGDIGRYDSIGNLVYMGRKDEQLKIRGQLLAPEETQYHIRRNLITQDDVSVIVDLVKFPNKTDTTLVAFLNMETEDEVESAIAGLEEKLKRVLPSYGIPAYYIPVPTFPTNASAKLDRKRLREIGAAFNTARQTSGSKLREPTTTAERALRELWATTLGIDVEKISVTDSFLRIGDSVQAMRLVGMARRQGLSLTVAEIFENPTLEEMAKVLRNREDGGQEITVAPFALLDQNQDLEHARQYAASLCGVANDEIEDLLPCTPLQVGLLALTMKRDGSYTGRNILQLAPSVEPARFRQAWDDVVATIPILRTRIIDLLGHGLVQAVIRRPHAWIDASGIDDYINKDIKLPMGLACPLMRCGLIESNTSNMDSAEAPSGRRGFQFALTMHHSIYDGLTLALIMEELETRYKQSIPLRHCPFPSFVKYVHGQDKDTQTNFWRAQFTGLEAAQFPILPSPTYQIQADSNLTHTIENLAWRTDNITPSTIMRAATALLCSQYSSIFDVVFGVISSGRKVPVGGIERLAGPTIATLPIRVRIDEGAGPTKLLETLQSQSTEMIPYEQVGLSAIRQISDEAEQACQFQTLLVVQMHEDAIVADSSSLFAGEVHSGEPKDNNGHRDFQSYALSIVCTPRASGLRVMFSYDSVVSPLADLGLLTNEDLNQIWAWNSENIQTTDKCVHHTIMEVAQAQPDSIAVSAWDGELTYGQLDRITTSFALRLSKAGVRRGTIIPICLEKSMYAFIAFLSVIKAGAAGFLLDTKLPEIRLKSSVLQLPHPPLILSSPSNEELASRILPNKPVLICDSDLLRFGTDNGVCHSGELPRVDPSDAIYAIFTSGSTGTPKGLILQHQSFSSAVTHQRSTMQLNSSSRMYDFASHAFDATYWSAFHVLAAGGTLCIPSESERTSDLTESMRRFGTTDLLLTPSTARVVDPSKIPTMRNIYLGGEEVTKVDVAQWMPYSNVVIVYGPSECSAVTLYGKVSDPMPSKLSIGKGIGTSTWIVDPGSSERLSPIGAVGELYLDGPLVGQGYLNDEEKTAATFIENPTWLLRGSPDNSVPGRRGRLYKTGDLVKYDTTSGEIIFVGRKDTQIKLRGQRIDLADVEHHVRSCLARLVDVPPLVAEVIVPKITTRPILVVFVQVGSGDEEQVLATIKSIEHKLRNLLPAYMVPLAYIPLALIPLSPSGKTDRKRLREMGADLTTEHLAGEGAGTGGSLPDTESQLMVRDLWATILGISTGTIYQNSSFIRLGGDSISAMRLAALARSRGISLTVQSILQAPRLSDMACAIDSSHDRSAENEEEVMPFSLLKIPMNKDETLRYISQQCNIDASNIEDILPCTSVQKSLLSMTAKCDNSYVSRYSMKLRDDIDIDRLKKAWEDVGQKLAPILRYRMLDVPSEGLVQIQIKEPLEWDTSDDINSYIELDRGREMGLGTRLTRLAIAKDPNAGGLFCVITQHHAIYDGYSVNLLLAEVSKAYSGIVDHSPVAQFRAFMKHAVGVDQEKATEFWRLQFSGSEAVPFPALPDQDYRPKANSTVVRNIEGFKWPKQDATASTIIRAAWTILTARYTGSDDIVYGAMVTGRQAPLAGIDRMIAPLISAVPVRAKFDAKQTVDELLRNIQSQSAAMIPYENTELLHIRRINTETESGSRFNTLLVVQPAGQSDYVGNGPFSQPPDFGSGGGDLDDFNPNAVMVMCQLNDMDGLQVEISFDSNVVDAPQMERMVAQFEHILIQICASASCAVEDIEVISQQDIRELWSWNSPVPDAIPSCVHDLIGSTAKRQPQAPAICAWDGSLTYAELDDLSGRLASYLASIGIGPGNIVPLCFEKSMWYPVAALGAIRAGAACVAMDSTQPESRLRSIVSQIGPSHVISSANNEELANRISDANVVVVGLDRIIKLSASLEVNQLPTVRPSDTLYVVFTSGSTGVPKGIVTTHQNFASAATHQAKILHINSDTRVFDFVSYSFDVSWSNHLHTFIRGGCLCIPSEWERKNDIVGALNRMNCDYVYFTPSVARFLEPSTLPTVRTLAMGGEPIQNSEVARWMQAKTIIGIYGPAECAQALSFALLSEATRNSHVGYSYGANTWLVEPGRPDRLAAVGTIAELVIEGPTVSKEYFGDLSKTTTSYIQDPLWLSQGATGHPGRSGTVYVTGDLLRYNSDGSLDFIGRRDGMIKLRGQRIELAEVEYHVRSSLREPGLCAGIAAEIIKPKNVASPLLAVFFSLAEEDEISKSPDDIQSTLARVLDGLEERLWDRVPQYMVPGAYIHVEKIPMTTTNKTDRRALQELGNAQTLETLAQLQSQNMERRVPSTPMEKVLQALWSSVLEIDAGSISADSSFLRIGGESIAAMRLVARARTQNLSLTVADIFKSPRLFEQALLLKHSEGKAEMQVVTPFSLLKGYDSKAFLDEFVVPLICSDHATVKDVVPATDFQELSISQALQDPPSRLPHWIFALPADVDFIRLREACTKLVNHYDILRTVFVQAYGSFWQVLLDRLEPEYDDYDGGDSDIATFVDSLCEQDLRRPRKLGQSFIRFMAVKNAAGNHKLVLRISHAQFDGFSWAAVLQGLSLIYNKELPHVEPPFGQFIAFNETKKEGSILYWSSRLQGSTYPRWIAGDWAVQEYNMEDRLSIRETIPIPSINQTVGISPATIFHAACAIALFRQFKQEDLVFGRLVTGRSMLPVSLQSIVGPTMTEVPIRTRVGNNDTLHDVALKLHGQFVDDSSHEAAGMVEIIRNCTDWPAEAKDFGWRTAFQQEDDADFTFLGTPSSISFYDKSFPPRSRPEIYATPKDGKLELELEANTRLISRELAMSFLGELKMVLGGH